MEKQLFEQIDYRNDPDWPIKSFLNYAYSQRKDVFLNVLHAIVTKVGYGLDCDRCIFPNMNTPYEEDRFEGVMFQIGDISENDHGYKIIITENECLKHIRQACKNYLAYHPEDEENIEKIFSKNQLA